MEPHGRARHCCRYQPKGWRLAGTRPWLTRLSRASIEERAPFLVLNLLVRCHLNDFILSSSQSKNKVPQPVSPLSSKDLNMDPYFHPPRLSSPLTTKTLTSFWKYLPKCFSTVTFMMHLNLNSFLSLTASPVTCDIFTHLVPAFSLQGFPLNFRLRKALQDMSLQNSYSLLG